MHGVHIAKCCAQPILKRPSFVDGDELIRPLKNESIWDYHGINAKTAGQQ